MRAICFPKRWSFRKNWNGITRLFRQLFRQTNRTTRRRDDRTIGIVKVQIGGGFERIHQHLGSSASFCLNTVFVGWADLTGVKLLAVATECRPELAKM